MGSAVKNADKKETRGGLQNFGEKRHLLTAEDRSKAGKRTANRAKFRNLLACAAEDQIDKILKNVNNKVINNTRGNYGKRKS